MMQVMSDYQYGASADHSAMRTSRRQPSVRTTRLERAVVNRRGFGGIVLYKGGKPVIIPPSQTGLIQLLSSDDTITNAKSPFGRHHALDQTVNQSALPFCACCFADTSFGIVINPGHPAQFLKSTDPCRLTLQLPCDPCGEGVVGHGA